MPTASADVVYFDPMFRKSAKSSSSFDMMRVLAFSDALSAEAVAEAQRVARRSVVVMDQRGGHELERLGLTVVHEGQRKRFGILNAGTANLGHGHVRDDSTSPDRSDVRESIPSRKRHAHVSAHRVPDQAMGPPRESLPAGD
mmetsp:Transcript_37116/g.86742  ORF Transcript_37116/g.86742 Transcript_37116/m.86742 type:complete len:142 (-) Transcript_37116:240-665(-)